MNTGKPREVTIMPRPQAIEMDIRYKISLKLVEINIQTAIEPERGSNAGNNLSNNTVEIGEARRSDSETFLADVINGFVVHLR